MFFFFRFEFSVKEVAKKSVIIVSIDISNYSINKVILASLEISVEKNGISFVGCNCRIHPRYFPFSREIILYNLLIFFLFYLLE